jgi:hypothetical protein
MRCEWVAGVGIGWVIGKREDRSAMRDAGGSDMVDRSPRGPEMLGCRCTEEYTKLNRFNAVTNGSLE